jgi:hypothetical protein
MRWKQFSVCILAVLCATGQLAVAQGPTSGSMFQNWLANRIQFSLVGGRIACSTKNGGWFGTRQVMTNGLIREEISLNGNGMMTGSIVYGYQERTKADQPNDLKVDFAIDLNSEGRFIMRYADKEQAEKCFELTQLPGQPIRLSLSGAGKPRVLRAPSIWHLLIINDEDCGKQFVPLLEAMRNDWHVAHTAKVAEDELVKMSAVSQRADRKQWEAWVNQLADPQYIKRDQADHHLRDVGPAVLGYLNRLNMNQLDAEQRSRLRRIIRDLAAQNGEDTPEHVASMLSEDPLVWLALLARPEEPTRQAAAQQLIALLNVPIAVDPKADPASQAKAREALRTRIEKTVGADDGNGKR